MALVGGWEEAGAEVARRSFTRGVSCSLVPAALLVVVAGGNGGAGVIA
jgi:hypothetical protein